MKAAPKTANEFRATAAADKARKDAVKNYENQKAKAGNAAALTVDAVMEEGAASTTAANTSVNADRLNDLWQRVRYFLNGKDEDGNDVEHGNPGRVRFAESCQERASQYRGSAQGLLPFDQVVNAFTSARLTMTAQEFRDIFRAIEAYHNEEQGLINWRTILSAPVERETQSLHGAFPRIVSIPIYHSETDV